MQRPVHLDEDFLRDVLGIVMVAGELVGDAIHHRSMLLDEPLEGGSVAPRRAGDQVRISLHHVKSIAARRLVSTFMPVVRRTLERAG